MPGEKGGRREGRRNFSFRFALLIWTCLRSHFYCEVFLECFVSGNRV